MAMRSASRFNDEPISKDLDVHMGIISRGTCRGRRASGRRRVRLWLGASREGAASGDNPDLSLWERTLEGPKVVIPARDARGIGALWHARQRSVHLLICTDALVHIQASLSTGLALNATFTIAPSFSRNSESISSWGTYSASS